MMKKRKIGLNLAPILRLNITRKMNWSALKFFMPTLLCLIR